MIFPLFCRFTRSWLLPCSASVLGCLGPLLAASSGERPNSRRCSGNASFLGQKFPPTIFYVLAHLHLQAALELLIRTRDQLTQWIHDTVGGTLAESGNGIVVSVHFSGETGPHIRSLFSCPSSHNMDNCSANTHQQTIAASRAPSRLRTWAAPDLAIFQYF